MHALPLAEVVAGFYINALKALPVLVVLVLWARLLTWVDKDTVAAHLPRELINTGLMVGLVLAFFLFVLLPGFGIALGAFLLVFVIEAATYLLIRKQKVGLGDLRNELAQAFRSKAAEEKRAAAKLVQQAAMYVQFTNAKNVTVEAPDEKSPLRAGFDGLQTFLPEPLRKEADQIDLVQQEGAGAVRYYVDGIAYDGPLLDRVRSSEAIGFAKDLAGLDRNEKRKPQRGSFKAELSKKRFDIELVTAGNNVGESMRLRLNPKSRHAFKLDTMGFSPDQLALLKDTVSINAGLVLLAAPKTQGLTSLMYGMLRGHDAFLSHVHTIERSPEDDLEGITQNKLPPNASNTDELKMVQWVTSQEPDVVAMSGITEPQSARELIDFVQRSGKRVYVAIRAGNTLDALTAWRKLVGDDQKAVAVLTLVVAGRVVRKLCQACKVGFRPEPDTLRRYNMDPDKVAQLFTARTQPMRDQKGNVIPCTFCHDLHFKGRTGMFECFVVDEGVQQAVGTGATATQLKALFRKQRGRYLQEHGLLLVEQGLTSVQEVQRVMKIGETPSK